MSKPVWLHHGPFPGHSAFVADKEAWAKLVKKLGSKGEPFPANDAAVTTFYETPVGRVMVVTVGEHIGRETNSLRLAAVIAHEVQHIWQGIKENIGEKAASPECEAYMVQWLLTQVLEAFEETRFKLFRGKAK